MAKKNGKMATDEKGPSHRVYKSKFRPFDGISENKFLSGAGVSSCRQEVIGGRCATEGKEKTQPRTDDLSS